MSDESGARGNILARIRARQGKPEAATADEREAVLSHVRSRPQHPRPRADWEPLARFRERALGLSSSVDEVESLAAAPAAVARYLRSNSLPLTVVCWTEFAELDWRSAGVEVAARAARDSDLVGITGAFCAIAETGTLMTVTGPRTPATVSLLPETHIAIVSAARIVRGMEEAWQLLRDELKQAASGGAGAPFRGCDPGADDSATDLAQSDADSDRVVMSRVSVGPETAVAMPRAVSFISGPSRTADIEQTVTLGAHGPYRVHIVITG
jgi:L-lactate dehydrogenase complex protein LldG